MQNARATIAKMLALRKWCKQNLPTDDSMIAYELILLLAEAHYDVRELTIKQTFSSLPYSYTPVRQHYKRFLKDGWITLVPNANDKRVKHVKPSPSLIKLIRRYTEMAEEVFG